MHPWFRWIFYLNPGAYAFDALMTNEFSGLALDCVSPQYIPFGPSYDNVTDAYRGCTVLGSDSTGLIDGYSYVSQQYSYATGHTWRGFGVLMAFWITFIAVTALGYEFRNSHSGSSVLLYKRSLRHTPRDVDVEKAEKRSSMAPTPVTAQLVKQSIFTWHDLDYHVKYQGQQKQLLNKVFGFVQPGNLVALMGCSGAGKTT